MNAFGLAPLLLILPAIGFLFNGIIGRRFVEADPKVGEKWSGWVGSALALGAFAVSVLLALSLAANDFEAHVVPMLQWISVPSAGFEIEWAIRVDTLSTTMMLVVSGVGSLIHIYAIGYMHGDKDFSRFFAYLNLFLFFMLILVGGDSYLMLFVGWEGVGLCSYLLIGFWFSEWKNADAGRKAFIANRVGDFAMILAMILTFWLFGTMQFDGVFESAVEMFESGEQVAMFGATFSLGGVLTAICALFLIGATGKSAQIPLYVWLPDAMAGPTPVSALIHAATMVTSGIYLIVRSNVLFEIVRESGAVIFAGVTAPDLVAFVGALTALWAGLIAFTQFDIKKVLAYSTVSQLGFMIAAVGMGAYVAGMFHLVTHAFFKALLFLGSGSVIHGMEHGHHHLAHGHDDHHGHEDAFDPQDMRTMGGLRHKMPVTFWTYIVGALALAGIPIFAGFWSKDEILAHAATNEGTIFLAVYIMLAVAAFFTAFYMARQVKMTFFGEPRHEAAEHAEESSPLMTAPLVVLGALATLGGFLNLPFFSESAYKSASEAHDYGIFLAVERWLEHSIESFHLTEEGIVHMPHTPTWLQWDVAIISTAAALLSIALAWFLVYRGRWQRADERDPLQGTPIWWMSVLPLDTLYMKGFIPLFNRFAHFAGITLDWKFWHDWFHEDIVRAGYINLSRAINFADNRGVDGLVRGAGSVTNLLSGLIRRTQTGFVRNYALSVLLGVVVLILLFVLPIWMN